MTHFNLNLYKLYIVFNTQRTCIIDFFHIKNWVRPSMFRKLMGTRVFLEKTHLIKKKKYLYASAYRCFKKSDARTTVKL